MNTVERLALIVGDVVFLYLSLWLALAIRTLSFPSRELLALHVFPFTLLFVLWLLVFLIAGLYDQHTTLFRRKLPDRIVRVQLFNVLLAALFFFSVPFFGIAPKTILVLYLGISSLLIILWRLHIVSLLLRQKPAEALLVGGGKEFKELFDEVHQNLRYPFHFTHTLNVDKVPPGALSEKLFADLRTPSLSFVVLDMRHPKLVQILPHLYKPLFSNVRFLDARDLYEDIFERLPLSALEDIAPLKRLALLPRKAWYEAVKRGVDVVGGIAMGLVTIAATPLVWLALKIEGPGPVFIAQERLGIHGTRMRAYKFRSMRFNDSASSSWVGEGENRITRVGAFLRKTSLDEFPQFVNVLRGELSLVGPRNDIVGLGTRLAEAISSYMIRYEIKPGITGWAQINQQYEQGNISPQSIEETRVRLAYDFYYLENRSLVLDGIIALKTIKKMIFRVSS